MVDYRENQMNRAAEELKSKLAELSTKDRAELAHYLIHSLDNSSDADAEAAWDTELSRRAEDIKNGTAVGEPADAVFKQLREKFS
jgi:putative addiction module component (TIGR02574 family)